MMDAPTPDLTAALIAAKDQMGPALKSAWNPHFKSKFVDLAAVGEAADAALAAHGLCIVQTTRAEGDAVVLVTSLLHISGQERSGSYPLDPAKQHDPQALGACLTYARRYAKMAMLDMAPEDDDGTTASRTVQPPAPAPQRAPSGPPPPAQSQGEPISEAQHRRLEARIGDLGLDRARVKRWVLQAWGVQHLTEVPRDKYDALYQRLDLWADAQRPMPPAGPDEGDEFSGVGHEDR
jgi:hypothetical protein